MDRAVALRALVGYAIVALTLLALSSWARGQSVDNAHALDEQAIELFRAGKFKKALDLSEQALALREKMLGPNDPDLAESLGTVAKLYMLEGRLADAEPYLSRAVGIVEKAVGRDHPAFGVVLNMLGELYIRQGRHDEAEATLKRALANLQNAPNLEDQLGLTLNNLAVLYQKQERIPEATRLIERAMTLREHALGPTHPEVARLIDSLGVLYTEQGDHVKAEALLKRALTMREQVLGHEHLEVGYSLSNLGNLYLTLGHLDEAKDATKRAISILQGALPAGHPDIATITNNLANIYEAEGKSQEAEATYRQVLSMREKLLPPGHPEIAQSVGTLSTMAFERQDWARALELVRQASRMWIALSRKTRTIENSELKRSSQLFRYHVLVAHRAGANDGSLLDETFEMAQWADRTAVAASLVAMSARQATGNGSLAQLIRLIQDYEKWRDATERAIIDAQGRGDKEQAVAEQANLAKTESWMRGVYAKIDSEFPGYGALISAEPVSVAETQKLLHADEALLQFLSTPPLKGVTPETFAWVVSKREARWVRLALTPSAIADAVAALRCGLDAAAWANGGDACRRLLGISYDEADAAAGKPLPFDLNRANQLHEVLLGPFKDIVKGKHLLIVASDALAAIPFSVLVTKSANISPKGYERARWLGVEHPISTLPSVASLKLLRSLKKETHAPEAYIGFGAPLLEGKPPACPLVRVPATCPGEEHHASATRGDRRLRGKAPPSLAGLFRGGSVDLAALRALCPLPDTAHELRCVAQSLGADEGNIHLGQAATEREIKRLPLDRYRVVHFATHGLLATQAAALGSYTDPALVLTPPVAASNDDDGLLTASEIGGLTLNADWVILSACNTAAESGASSEALSGLANAFFYAGARALLVSHWEVFSEAAVELTTNAFAETRANAAIGRAEAMRRSMSRLVKQGGLKAHPTYWAVFSVVGEGAPDQNTIDEKTPSQLLWPSQSLKDSRPH